LDSGESGTFPKVRRKEKNKNKNVTSGISEQQKYLVTFNLDGI
jgi:hypothetical protein